MLSIQRNTNRVIHSPSNFLSHQTSHLILQKSNKKKRKHYQINIPPEPHCKESSRQAGSERESKNCPRFTWKIFVGSIYRVHEKANTLRGLSSRIIFLSPKKPIKLSPTPRILTVQQWKWVINPTAHIEKKCIN